LFLEIYELVIKKKNSFSEKVLIELERLKQDKKHKKLIEDGLMLLSKNIK
jgi:hypothetical protein